MTFGGYKGASIALMVEVLCAALVGADFSHEVDWSKNPGAVTARTGETIILIDPSIGAEALPATASRVDVLVSTLRAAGQEHIPGERRLQLRALHQGRVTIPEADWMGLHKLLPGA